MATEQQSSEQELTIKAVFQFFNEIGIINQLSSTAFNRQLPAGLHLSHFSVLNHLVRLSDGRTPSAIARAFQVTKGNMTNTLSELERRGFIALKPNPGDRRSKLVMLKAAGRKFHANAINSIAPMVAALSSQLDLEKIRAVTPMLQEVREVLDNNRDL